MGMDVLEFGDDHAADDALHLLRNSAGTRTKEIRPSAEFRGLSLRQRRLCDGVRSNRPRRKDRLVALRIVHGVVRGGFIVSAEFTRDSLP